MTHISPHAEITMTSVTCLKANPPINDGEDQRNDNEYTYYMDWVPENYRTWYFENTVDAYDGEHPSGKIYRQYLTIRTDAQVTSTRIGENNRDACQWWFDTLKPIHEARCAMAEATPAEIEMATEKMDVAPDEDAYGYIFDTDDLEISAAHAKEFLAALTEVYTFFRQL